MEIGVSMDVPQILAPCQGENLMAVDIKPKGFKGETGAAGESSLQGLRCLERGQWLDVSVPIAAVDLPLHFLIRLSGLPYASFKRGCKPCIPKSIKSHGRCHGIHEY